MSDEKNTPPVRPSFTGLFDHPTSRPPPQGQAPAIFDSPSWGSFVAEGKQRAAPAVQPKLMTAEEQSFVNDALAEQADTRTIFNASPAEPGPRARRAMALIAADKAAREGGTK